MKGILKRSMCLAQSTIEKELRSVKIFLLNSFYGMRFGLAAALSYWRRNSTVSTFTPLTPIILPDESIVRYESELLSALRGDQVRNIAITGDYGAGKSSFIKSFEKRNPIYTYAYVSLATFNEDDSAASPTSFTEKIDGIEGTIVQQLLYSVPTNRLPKTRLKRINHVSLLWATVHTLFLCLFIVAFLRLYTPEALKKIADLEFALNWLYTTPSIAALMLIFSGVAYVSFLVLRLLASFNVDGLTVKGGKLEANNHSSVLHKHVDELIYCFERSSIDVVFIEDLDRFKIQEVFFRLREINFIINRSPQINRTIYFVYALRDEMFSSKERTKFFDLIIPIVPIVNSENSKEQFVLLLKKRKFKSGTLHDIVDHHLLEAISYYVDDMRLVINIVNEFDIYASVLTENIQLNPNKLFSIVAIKNLYPEDYASLIRREGNLYKIFKIYDEWKDVNLKSYDVEAQDVALEVDKKSAEVADDVESLRILLWHKIGKLGGGADYSQIRTKYGQSQFGISQFVEDAFFETLITDNSELQPIHLDYHGGHTLVGSAVPIQRLLSSSTPSYEERVKVVSSSLTELSLRAEEISDERANFKLFSFKEAVVTRSDLAKLIMDHNKLHNLQAINYLVRAGLFGVDYIDYLGHFYQGSLSYEDKNLIIFLREGQSQDVTVRINNPRGVLEKLSIDDVGGGRGILLNLVEHLRSHGALGLPYEKDEYLSEIFRYSEQNVDRVESLLDAMEEFSSIQFVLKALSDHAKCVFRLLLTEGEVFSLGDRKQDLIIAILASLTASQLEDLSKSKEYEIESIIAGLESVTKVLPALSVESTGWRWLKSRSVKFNNLRADINPEHLKLILEHGYIELNLHMLNLLESVFRDDTMPIVSNLSYAHISRLQAKGLSELIQSNSAQFVKALLSQPGKLPETSESLEYLIKQASGEVALAKELISRTDVVVNDIQCIAEELWEYVISNCRIAASWANVLSYFEWRKINEPEEYKENSLGGQLMRYIALPEHAEDISGSTYNDSQSETLTSFVRSTFSCDALDDQIVKTIFSQIELEHSDLVDVEISSDRWRLLISLPTLPYSKEIFAVVVEKVPELAAAYLLGRWEWAKKDYENFSLREDSALIMSHSEKLSIPEKVKLWRALSPELILSNAPVAREAARVFALASNVDGVDLSLTLPVLKALFAADSADSAEIDDVKQIFVAVIPKLAWADIKELLIAMNEDGFNSFAEGNRKSFSVENSEVNRALVDAFNKAGYVGSRPTRGMKIVATIRPDAEKTNA